MNELFTLVMLGLYLVFFNSNLLYHCICCHLKKNKTFHLLRKQPVIYEGFMICVDTKLDFSLFRSFFRSLTMAAVVPMKRSFIALDWCYSFDYFIYLSNDYEFMGNEFMRLVHSAHRLYRLIEFILCISIC